MNAQVFKSEALTRLAVRLPEAVPVMAKVDIDPAIRLVQPFRNAFAVITFQVSWSEVAIDLAK